MKTIKKYLSVRRVRLIFMLAVVAGLGFGVSYGLYNRSMDITKAECIEKCVSLGADKADPQTITTTKGSYVQFNSADGKAHNLSLGKGGDDHEHRGKFHSGEFQADEAWRIQLNDEGIFFFHDHLNPKINILVVVYSPGKDYKIE